eukprot:GEMP01006507.1.p1 GENE.GEMP01006507.1~~GEMP01006507.1.p1  ORF type:complete len:904 (+),score=230.41 GEMP01006507.1:20-2731(+)
MEAFEKSFVSQGPVRCSNLHRRLRQRQAPAVAWGNWDIAIESEVNMHRAENVRFPISIWSTPLHTGLKLATRRVAMSSWSARGSSGDKESRLALTKKKIELDLVKSRVLKSGKNVKIWAHHFTTDAHTVAATMLSHPFFALEMQEDTKDFEVACCSFAETPKRSLVVAIVAWMGSEHIPFGMDLTALRQPLLSEPRCVMMRRLLEELCLTALCRKGPIFRCKESCYDCDKMCVLLKGLYDDWVQELDDGLEHRGEVNYEARRTGAIQLEDPVNSRHSQGGAQHLDHVISRHSTRENSVVTDLSRDHEDRARDTRDAPVIRDKEVLEEVEREGHCEDEVVLFADQLSEGMQVVAVTEKGTHCPVVIKSDSHNFYLSILRTDKAGKSGGVGQTKAMKLSEILGAEDDECLVTIALDEDQKFKLLMPTKTNAHFLARLLTAFGQGSSAHSEATPAPSQDYAAQRSVPEPLHEPRPNATPSRAQPWRSSIPNHSTEFHDADRRLYPRASQDSNRTDIPSSYAHPRPHTARSYFDMTHIDQQEKGDLTPLQTPRERAYDFTPLQTPRERAFRDATRRADDYLQRAWQNPTSTLTHPPSAPSTATYHPGAHLLPSSPPPSAGGNRGLFVDGTPDLAPSFWRDEDGKIAAGNVRAHDGVRSQEDFGAADVRAQVRELHRRAANPLGSLYTAGSTSGSAVVPAEADLKNAYSAHMSGIGSKDTFATPLRSRMDAAPTQQQQAPFPRASAQPRQTDVSSRHSSKSTDGPPLDNEGERRIGVDGTTAIYSSNPFRRTSGGSGHLSPRGSRAVKTAWSSGNGELKAPRSARGVGAEDGPFLFKYRHNGSLSARYAANPEDMGGHLSEAPTRDSTASSAYTRFVANANSTQQGLVTSSNLRGTESYKKIVHPIPR